MSLPAEFVLGLYIGLLTGIIPALVAGVLGFVFRYFTGVTLPGLGVVVLAVAVAGVNGGLLGLIDPTIQQSPRLLVALTVVMMLALYAHNQGDKLGASLPRRFSLRSLRRQTLSADVISVVGGIGQVTIRPVGEVDDVEGYPPLGAELRGEIASETWDLPADLPLAELEARLEDRLRTDYDLADVSVAIDERGRASIAAAPPMGGLSRRIPEGHRAVSIAALVPTGIARGDRVRLDAGDDRFDGRIVSARSDAAPRSPIGGDPAATDGGQPTAGSAPAAPTAPTTAGGEGRVTVALPRSRATKLLSYDRGRVVVRSRGTRREFELLSLFRRSGKRIAKVPIGAGSPLAATTIGEAAIRDAHGVAVLAVRSTRGDSSKKSWTFSPDGSTLLSAGDECFVVGSRDAIEQFRGDAA
ncbi:TrkA-C domain protein [Salinarchaeum sp. Harcht-Bsk1]|uniref:potassium channel family protein n=1 Tax=Salinarchaeum sp. Harcht-Bsk1 TaxID=1333523 RepID=UPI0003423845|nr:TrkA C-terminal domain-containing protein [Salinarchaeum sp. Harcht-Bsk1]AGN00453.1 TrkA-C domain protein [Salinarchaeum sp. Harcht-Bsk1]